MAQEFALEVVGMGQLRGYALLSVVGGLFKNIIFFGKQSLDYASSRARSTVRKYQFGQLVRSQRSLNFGLSLADLMRAHVTSSFRHYTLVPPCNARG